jgi:predicted MPP superfamily phosphohydrolase
LRSIFLQIFLNAYLLYRIRRSKFLGSSVKRFLYLLFGSEIILFLTGFFGREWIPAEYFVYIFKINAYWSIFFVYTTIILIICDLILYLNRKWIFYVKIKESIIRSAFIGLSLAFFTYLGLHLKTGENNYLAPQIKEIPVPVHLVSNDTIVKTSYKMAVISDVHVGYLIDTNVLRHYVQAINELQPDIVVINGDLIDYYLKPLNDQEISADLRRIEAPEGVYFVPGNHEYKRDQEANFQWIRQSGLILLRDSVANIGAYLQLIGRDDRKNKDERQTWDQLLAQTDPKKVHILFAHQPQDVTKEVLAGNIPLIVSGHTHGGQIFPVNWINRMIFSNSYGMMKRENSYCYTTSGLGLSGFPFRIDSESEIVVFNIQIY